MRRRHLVPLVAVQDLITAAEKTNELVALQADITEKAQKQRNRTETSQRTVQRTIGSRKTPYLRWTRIAPILAVATAGAGLFGKDVIASLNELLPTVLPRSAAPFLVLASALLAIVAFSCGQWAKHLEAQFSPVAARAALG